MKDKDIKMAQIPYIEHEYRMYKAYKRHEYRIYEAYKRENRLKCILIGTNIIWAVIALILVAG